MTNAKVKVSKEVAEAIELVRQYRTPAQIVEVSVVNGWGDEGDDYAECLNSCRLPLDTIIAALYYGYEIEKSPEEIIREKYEELFDYEPIDRACKDSLRFVLDTLGIKIEGVNA